MMQMKPNLCMQFILLFSLLFLLFSKTAVYGQNKLKAAPPPSSYQEGYCEDDDGSTTSSGADYTGSTDSYLGMFKQFALKCANVLGGKKDDSSSYSVCKGNRFRKNPYFLRNWGSSFDYDTQNIEYPRTVAEVQEVVKAARKLRVIGNRHSYSEIGNSDDTILSTMGLNTIISINTSVPSVLVQPGVTYTDLAPILLSYGYALPNLAILAEITVAGATQTCVHGSGIGNKNLATQVRSVQLVKADGSVANFGPDCPELNAVVCGLGAFGVVTQIELLLEFTYNVTTYEYIGMKTEDYYAYFDVIHQLGYSVNTFTYQYGTGTWDYVVIAARSGSHQDNGLANLTNLFSATKSTAQFSQNYPIFIELNKEQPWYNGIPVYQIGLSGSGANEIQTEYFVPMENAVAAMQELEQIAPAIRSVFTVHLVRTIAPDDHWMSPHQHSGPMVSIHFSWQNNKTALAPVLAQVEATLIPYGARPHWAKYFTMSPSAFLKHYPKLEKFRKLAKEMDPKGKFCNKFLNDNVFNGQCV